MPVVKIKELPVKSYPELEPTDVMVLEDTSDTKQITIEQLKLFFSSDQKIQAITEYLEGLNEELRKDLEEHIKDCSGINEDLESRLSNLFEDHERTKAQVGDIQEQLVDAQNDIKDIKEHLTNVDSQIGELQEKVADHEERITANEKQLADHEDRIVALEEDNNTNKENISQLQKDLQSLTTHVEEEIKRLDDRITQINTENHEYTDKAYDNLMLYIDYYHHVHEFPPNFDEPYKGDPMVARYIHPVGTIFETQDPDFRPEKWFPGTWKFVGTGASLDEDGNRVLDYYTYVRLE